MTELLFHAASGDAHFGWPPSKASQRTLPLPSSYEPYTAYRAAPAHHNAPPTPPPTTSINAGPVLPLPLQRPCQELTYPLRTHNAAASVSSSQREEAPSSNTHVKTQPTLATLAQAEPEERHSPSSNTATSPAFKLPSTIVAPQSDLPQLAAEVACLFWYEDASTIAKIERHLPGSPVPANAIVPSALASSSFRKWVAQLLATTQVTQNVIILALLFIYKLRSFNPKVKGGPNSEFKLMTVALMLGNKFLDDNTYTNKTWAEVSGMPVQDIHIMEVEFLSNMRYSLFTSEKQWNMWHLKLGKIGTYIHSVTQARQAATRPVLLAPLASHASMQSPTSPSRGFHHLSPSLAVSYSPMYAHKTNTPILLPQPGTSAISPIGPLPELGYTGQKRCYDESLQEPSAKRHAPSNYQSYTPNQRPPSTSTVHGLATHRDNPPPQLPPSTSAVHGLAAHRDNPPPHLPSLPLPTPSHTPAASLPTLPASAARAMSLVYSTPVQMHPQVSQAMHLPALQTSGLPTSLYPERHRQLSPFHMGSATASPVHPVYTSSTAQTARLSPSYFLQQRSSPYRPVRQVQTLLAPPSSTPSYHAPRLVTHDHLQYHPLGRPMNERRFGHLPYLDHEAWPQTHQLNQWSETVPPPPPNFYA